MPVKNREIESLRAFAILLVMLRHMHYALPISLKDYPGILQGTWAGVDLFFVISGYVITLSLQRSKQPTGSALKNFYIRRLLRLLPVSIVVLAAIGLCTLFFNNAGQFPNTSAFISELPYILLYVYNIFLPKIGSELGWFWSLSIEEQFYIFYPIIFLFIVRGRRLAVFLATLVIVINLVFRPLWAQMHSGSALWPDYITPTFLRIDLLAMGCLIAMVQDRFVLKNKWAWILSFFVLSVAGAPVIGLSPVLIFPLILIAAGICVGTAAAGRNAIPVSKFLDWTGSRSYVLYLINIPVLWFGNELFFRLTKTQIKTASLGEAVIHSVMVYSITIILAELLHLYVERPCIRLARKLTKV